MHFLFLRGLGRFLFLAGKREVSPKFALYAVLLLGVQNVSRYCFPLLYKEKRGFLGSPVSDKKQNRHRGLLALCASSPTPCAPGASFPISRRSRGYHPQLVAVYHQHEVLYIIKPQGDARWRVMRYSPTGADDMHHASRGDDIPSLRLG